MKREGAARGTTITTFALGISVGAINAGAVFTLAHGVLATLTIFAVLAHGVHAAVATFSTTLEAALTVTLEATATTLSTLSTLSTTLEASLTTLATLELTVWLVVLVAARLIVSVVTWLVVFVTMRIFGFVAGAELGVLDGAALAAHIVEAAVKNHILSQLALDVAIEQRIMQRSLETQVVDKLLVGTHDEPAVVAYEHFFELGAQGGIELRQLVAGEALAVGWVGDEHTLLRGCLLLLERHALHLDILRETRILDIGVADGNSLAQNVVAVNLVGELTLTAVVVINGFKNIGIIVGPLLEGIFLTIHARVDVGGYQSGLNQECARAAHRIHEVALAVPAAELDDACR